MGKPPCEFLNIAWQSALSRRVCVRVAILDLSILQYAAGCGQGIAAGV